MSSLTLEEFAIECLLNRIDTPDGPVYWRETTEDHEGYIMIWPNGNSHHTYRHPERIYEK